MHILTQSEISSWRRKVVYRVLLQSARRPYLKGLPYRVIFGLQNRLTAPLVP